MCIRAVTHIRCSFLIVVVVANPSVENPTLCAWLHPTSYNTIILPMMNHQNKWREKLIWFISFHALKFLSNKDMETKPIWWIFIITTAYAQFITFFLINITNPFTQKFCIRCAISEIANNQLLKLQGVCQISRNPRLPQIPNKPNEKYMQRHTNTQLTPNKCAATVGIQINYFLKEKSTKQKSNQIIIRSNAARANHEKNWLENY